MRQYKHIPSDPNVWMGDAIEKVIKTIDSIETMEHVNATLNMVVNLYEFFVFWSPTKSSMILDLLLCRIEIVKSNLKQKL